MKYFTLLACFFWAGLQQYGLFAQTFRCGYQPAGWNISPVLQAKAEQDYRQIIETQSAVIHAQARSPTTLPVVVHLVYDGPGANLGNAQIQAAIGLLNEAFAETGPFADGAGADTDIRFCLASRDPQGNPTTGILPTPSPLANLQMETQDGALKQLGAWDTEKYINIWVVEEICSNTDGCAVAGYASAPWMHGEQRDGIVVEAFVLSGSTDFIKLLVHEIGHYLGLLHTFEGGCSNSDCLADGDRVCDTPPDNSVAVLPCGSAANTCQSDVNPADGNNPFTTDQQDLENNYMDYSYLPCQTAFTSGQIARMAAMLDLQRALLRASDGCTAPCPAAVSATIETIAGPIPVGEAVVFQNQSSGAQLYAWTVDGMVQGTGFDFTYTFPQAGAYTIRLVASSSNPLCPAAEDSMVLQVICPVALHLELSNTQLTLSDTLHLQQLGSTQVLQWYVNNVPVTHGSTWDTLFDQLGVYTIRLEGIGANCKTDTTVLVSVGSCDAAADMRVQKINRFGQLAALANGENFVMAGYDRVGQADYPTIHILNNVGSPILSRKVYYDFGFNGKGDIRDVAATSDSGFVCVIAFDGSGDSWVLAKFDGAGVFRWARRLPPDNFKDMIVLRDGGIVATFDRQAFQDDTRLGMQKYSASGDLVWSKTYRVNPGHAASNGWGSIAETPDHKLVTIGLIRYPAVAPTFMADSSVSHILVFDAMGNLLRARGFQYDKNLFNGSEGFRHDVTVGQNNEYWASISTTGFPGQCIILLDSNLQVRWTRRFFIQSTPDSDPNLWVRNIADQAGNLTFLLNGVSSGRPSLVQTDTAGNIHWERHLGFAPFDNFTAAWDQGWAVTRQYPWGNANMFFRTNTYGQFGDCYPDLKVVHTAADSLRGRYLKVVEEGPQPLLDTLVLSMLPFNMTATLECLGEINDIALKARPVLACTDSLTLNVDICNHGSNLLSARLPLAFYAGNPFQQGAVLLDTLWVEVVLPADSCQVYTVKIPRGPLQSTTLYAMANDDGSLPLPVQWNQLPGADLAECLFFNNLDSIRFDAFPLSMAAFSLGNDTTICPNKPLVLQAPPDYATYAWQDGANGQIMLAGHAGLYWVKLTDQCGVTAVDSINIQVFPASPALELGADTTICPGAVLPFNVFEGYTSYVWQDSSANPFYTATHAGVFHLRVGDACGFTQEDSIRIRVDSASLAGLPDKLVLCAGDLAVIAGPDGFFTYQWLTQSFPLTCDTCQSIQFLPQNSGTMFFTGLSASGCRVSDTTYVSVFNPEIDFDLTPLHCPGDSNAVLSVYSTQAPVSWSIDNQVFTAVDTFAGLSAGSYWLYVRDSLGCTDSLAFEVPDAPPQIIQLPADTTILLGESYQLQAVTSPFFELSEIVWLPEEGLSCVDCPDPLASPLTNTLYLLSASTADGCLLMDSVWVRVDTSRFVLTIPNAFSPNGDGSNDLFGLIDHGAINQIEFFDIRDRWGKLVFHVMHGSPDAPQAKWDGNINGTPASSDVYVYHIRVKLLSGASFVFSGEVTLLR